MQAERKRVQDQTNAAASNPPPTPLSDQSSSIKRKRKAQPDDEIEAVFNATLGKRIKKAALDSVDTVTLPATILEGQKGKKNGIKHAQKDGGLEDVLGAIRTAPKGEETRGKKRH